MFKKLFGGKDSKNIKDAKENKDNKNTRGNKYQFVTKQPTTKTCPYCGFNLEVIPKRKKKCPNCGDDIFVSKGKLYTKEEKDIRDWLRRVEDLGITRKMFNDEREKLSERFGLKASINDTAWTILNSINTPNKSYQDRKFIYLAMAHILQLEDKSTKEIMVQAHKMDLLEMKELVDNSGIEMMGKILTCNDDLVCDECRKLSKKVFTVDEALKTMPIPHQCTNKNCRCWWAFELPNSD